MTTDSGSDQRRGIFGGTFHGNAVGVIENHNYPPVPPIDPIEAKAKFEQLPTDVIPDYAAFASFSRMRYSKLAYFTGRKTELSAMAVAIKQDVQAVIVNTGIAGIGKTSLAIDFVHRYGQFFAGGVFWLSFAEPDQIAGEVASAGVRLGIPAYTTLSQADQVDQVYGEWQKDIPRLLVFDNCDDERAADLVRKWKPKMGGCRILVTSRRTTWNNAMRQITVTILPRHDSITFLQRICEGLSDTDADEIANALGDLPLALHLAGHYLARYGATVQKIKQLLTTLVSDKALEHAALQARGLEEKEIDRVWVVETMCKLSYEKLDPTNDVDAGAIKALTYAALLAPGEGFPHALLQQMLLTIEPDEDTVTDAIKRIINTGLLEEVDSTILRLHRLIAVFANTTITDADALGIVENVVLAEAKKIYHAGFLLAMQLLGSHLQHVTTRALEREDERAGNLAAMLATHLWRQGEYQKALQLNWDALAISTRVLGAEHPDTLSSMSNLAVVLYSQGEYGEATRLHWDTLAISTRVLGAEHPNTLTSMTNLAEVLCAQGEYGEAQRLHRDALAISTRVLGAEHPLTLTSMNNLAVVLQLQGEYGEARCLLWDALAILTRVLGAEHPNTLGSMNNLARVLGAQGEYGEATRLSRDVLALRTRVLGTEHPDTLTSMTGLANVLRAQGEYGEATRLSRDALAISTRVLGAEHPLTLTSMNNLAVVLESQGEYGEATRLHWDTLAIVTGVLGAEHPNTLTSMNNLAVVLRAQGEYGEATRLDRDALAILTRVLGAEHPDTLTSMNNLALVLGAHGEYGEATRLHRDTLERRTRVLGTEHPDTLTSMNNLATVLRAQGEYGEATRLHRDALALRTRVLGAEHPDTFSSMTNLASALYHQNEFTEYATLLEQVVVLLTKILGANHPNTVQAMQLLRVGQDRLREQPSGIFTTIKRWFRQSAK